MGGCGLWCALINNIPQNSAVKMLKQLVVKDISHRNTPNWAEEEEEERGEKNSYKSLVSRHTLSDRLMFSNRRSFIRQLRYSFSLRIEQRAQAMA